jgi:predicted DNA-binding transcriptional regulator AlpA
MQIEATHLADLIADKLCGISIPITAKYWGKEQIAEALSVSISSVEKMSLRPDFPECTRLPSRGKGAGSRRWKATDIMDWMESRKSRRAGK